MQMAPSALLIALKARRFDSNDVIVRAPAAWSIPEYSIALLAWKITTNIKNQNNTQSCLPTTIS